MNVAYPFHPSYSMLYTGCRPLADCSRKSCFSIYHPTPTNVNDDSTLNPRAHNAHKHGRPFEAYVVFQAKTQSSFILPTITEQWTIIPPFAQNGTSYSAVVLYKVKRRHCYCTPCSVCMAKRFHIGFYAKCKKCDEMYICCICRLEEEAFWATSWQKQQNNFCAQRRLRSAWASAQSDQSLRCALSG